MYRARAVRGAKRRIEGLGSIENIPFLYFEWVCQKCKKVSRFDSHSNCICRKRHKFGATRILVNGLKFPSLKEGKRYSRLSFLVKHSEISDLELQPAFIFKINEKKVCSYIADFRYKWKGKLVTEDVKGVMTAVFKLKLKLLEALFPEVHLDIV